MAYALLEEGLLYRTNKKRNLKIETINMKVKGKFLSIVAAMAVSIVLSATVQAIPSSTAAKSGFVSSNTSILDSGMTLLLLGMGLAALGVFAGSRKQVLA